jgi:hypothetical protein
MDGSVLIPLMDRSPVESLAGTVVIRVAHCAPHDPATYLTAVMDAQRGLPANTRAFCLCVHLIELIAIATSTRVLVVGRYTG